MDLLLFRVGVNAYALNIAAVVRVALAAEFTTLPQSQGPLVGALNIQGEVLPVYDARFLLGKPTKALDVADHFIICQTPRNHVILWVDAIIGVERCAEELLQQSHEHLPQAEEVDFLIKKGAEIVLVYNLDRLLAGAMAT